LYARPDHIAPQLIFWLSIRQYRWWKMGILW